MQCEECGDGDAARTVVRYGTGDEETIPLCDECRREYADGGLVEEVVPADS